MKVLLVVPEIRLDDKPYEFPFWSGILASIVEKKGGDVAILDLNALRMNYGGGNVPTEVIKKEISAVKWYVIGVGGLTTTYKRLKQLIPFALATGRSGRLPSRRQSLKQPVSNMSPIWKAGLFLRMASSSKSSHLHDR